MSLSLCSVFTWLCGHERLSYILSHTEPLLRGLINSQGWSEEWKSPLLLVTMQFNSMAISSERVDAMIQWLFVTNRVDCRQTGGLGPWDSDKTELLEICTCIENQYSHSAAAIHMGHMRYTGTSCQMPSQAHCGNLAKALYLNLLQ